jgi:hypothetical protein
MPEKVLVYRQFSLRSDPDVRLMVWLASDSRLVPGAKLTLKETGQVVWTVVERFSALLEREALHKPWRVGGLQ